MRTFRVCTFCEPGETRKSKVRAYTGFYNLAWEGAKEHTVEAENGQEAKKKAIELRLAFENQEQGE